MATWGGSLCGNDSGLSRTGPAVARSGEPNRLGRQAGWQPAPLTSTTDHPAVPPSRWRSAEREAEERRRAEAEAALQQRKAAKAASLPEVRPGRACLLSAARPPVASTCLLACLPSCMACRLPPLQTVREPLPAWSTVWCGMRRERAGLHQEEAQPRPRSLYLPALCAPLPALSLQEPAAGTPGTTLIRIRLPDGANHQRRFRAEDPMQVSSAGCPFNSLLLPLFQRPPLFPTHSHSFRPRLPARTPCRSGAAGCLWG